MSQSAVPQTSYEPYGELASFKTAGGYKTQVSYELAPQGGTDYGLPTKLSGDAITQLDGSQRQSITSATYDTHGNLLCRQTNAGGGTTATVVMTYDSLNRVTAVADPDDASLSGSCASKIAGIAGSAIVTRATYYADESLESVQTPSEAAANGGTTFTYDLDGDLMSQAPYTSTPQNTQTPTVKNWFDGMDRMVETQQPADPHTPGDIPISQRFLYDLSQGGSAATFVGATVTAYGNMFDIEKNTPTSWTDLTYSSFDSANRVTNKYAFAPCPAQQGGPSGAIYCSQSAYGTRYDWDSSPSLNPSFSAPGLLIATLDGTGASRKYTYDGIDEVDTMNYAGDNGVTTPVSYSYDFDGRLTSGFASYPSGTSPQNPWWGYTYNADGMLTQMGISGTGISYAYYPDSLVSTVSATQSNTTYGDIVNQPSLQTYEYRSDGHLTKETFGAANQAVSWAYTPGGRMTSQTDFSGSPSITAQYGDGYGRLSAYTTPSGVYGSIHYDAEGRMTQYTDPYAAIDGETVMSTYNIRGDLIVRSFSGGTAGSKPGFQYKNIQGVLVQNATDQYDGRTGAPLILGDASGAAVFAYDSVGRMRSGNGSVLSYDAENRLVSGDTFGAASAGDANCQSGGAMAQGLPPVPEVSYQYDPAGRLYRDTQPPITMFNGSKIPQIRQWVWDGSTPLYTMAMNSNGTVKSLQGYGADGVGSIDGSTGALTIADSDFDGAIAQYHNSTGHSSWTASNAYNQFCQHTTPLSPSPNYFGPGMSAVATDGTSDQSLVVSSTGRTYMSSAMGYTTPDYSSVTPYSSQRAALGESVPAAQTDPVCPADQVYDSEKGKCVPGRVPARAPGTPPITDPGGFPPITGSPPGPGDTGWPGPDLPYLGVPDDPFGVGKGIHVGGYDGGGGGWLPGGLGIPNGLFRTFGLGIAYTYDTTFQGGAYRLTFHLPNKKFKFFSYTCIFESQGPSRYGIIENWYITGTKTALIQVNYISPIVTRSETSCTIQSKGMDFQEAGGVSFL